MRFQLSSIAFVAASITGVLARPQGLIAGTCTISNPLEKPYEISLERRDGTACKLKATNADLSEGFGSTRPFAPSVGNLEAYMIFVDFSDAPATETTTSLRDFFDPGASDWYKNSSYGKLNLQITADTSKFYRMPGNTDSYNFQRSLTYQDHQRYIQDAVKAAGSSINFTGKDLLYIVATRNAPKISFSPTFMNTVTATDGSTVGKCVTLGYDSRSWGFKVMNHETGHAMGLPDLYPYSGQTTQYMGGFDMMGLISGPAPDYISWNKWKLGWLTDAQFNCVSGSGTSTHTLTPVETADGLKGVVVKLSETTAIVAEVRAPLVNDLAICAPGVLIYKLSTSIASGNGLINVYDSTLSSTGCAGDKKNDATYTTASGRNTLTDSGVTITVTGQSGNNYTISVTVA